MYCPYDVDEYTPIEYVELFSKFILKNYISELERLMLQQTDDKAHCGLTIE